MYVASWCCTCFCVVLCVNFCTGHFVMVPLNLISTLFTTFFIWTSFQFILKKIPSFKLSSIPQNGSLDNISRRNIKLVCMTFLPYIVYIENLFILYFEMAYIKIVHITLLTWTRCIVANIRLCCISDTVQSAVLGFRVCTQTWSGPGAVTARHRTRGPRCP